MSFLHPLALWGMAFLAVPILLLLFLNRRKLVLHWAAYEWMRKAIIRNRQRIQLTEILKLISKLLLLAALVLLVGRPYVRMQGGSGDTLLILDVSPSMGATYENGTRLDRARELAQQLVARHQGKLALYTFAGDLEPIVGDFTDDQGLLKERLAGLGLRGSYAGFSTLVDQLLASPVLGRASRIVVVGDFQACWYGDGPRVAEYIRRLGRGYPMTWIQVDDRSPLENVAVSGLDLSSEGALPGRGCFLTVELINGSEQPTGDRILSVSVGDRQVARMAVRLEAGEKREVPVVVSFPEAGFHNVRAALDADILLRDNVRYGVAHVPPPLRVLAVVPLRDQEPFPLDTYVQAALKSLVPREHLSYRSLSPLEFESARLDGVDLVVFVKLALRAGTPPARKALEFLEGGGAVMAFLPAQLPDEASAFGVAAAAPPGPVRASAQQLKGTYLEFMSEPGMKPESIAFTRTLVFPSATAAETRLATDGGANALFRRVGRGRLALFGFTPFHGATTFAFNPNFVQAVLRALWEARGFTALRSHAGDLKEWRAENLSPDRVYTLLDSANVSRALPLDGRGADSRLVLPVDAEPGFCSVQEDGAEIGRYGHNVDTGDSLLEPVKPSDLDAAVREGLTFSQTADVLRGVGRRDLVALTTILLLAAIALEAYAHFFRRV